jgi:hypothetical protein
MNLIKNTWIPNPNKLNFSPKTITIRAKFIKVTTNFSVTSWTRLNSTTTPPNHAKKIESKIQFRTITDSNPKTPVLNHTSDSSSNTESDKGSDQRSKTDSQERASVTQNKSRISEGNTTFQIRVCASPEPNQSNIIAGFWISTNLSKETRITRRYSRRIH